MPLTAIAKVTVETLGEVTVTVPSTCKPSLR